MIPFPTRSSHAAPIALLAWLLPAGSAAAIDIELVYDDSEDDAVHCCADQQACCDPGEDRLADLAAHLEVAAAIWEDIIEDDRSILIRYWFSSNASPSAAADDVDALGRPTHGHIRIPGHIDWWYDDDPEDDAEFSLSPKLYRTMLPVEQARAFVGNPREILEVGYNGAGPNGDLLSVVLHEMGHVLGLSEKVLDAQPFRPCEETSNPYFYPDDYLHGGGGVLGIRAYRANNGDFDCGHVDVGGITECEGEDEEAWCKRHQSLMWFAMLPNARSFPSLVDIMTIADAADWQEIDYPRKYSLASGHWNAPGTWMGDRVPDADDDVYIVNAAANPTVELFGGGVARNVFLTDDNALSIFFSPLDVGGLVDLDGEGTFLNVDSAATLRADELRIDDGSRVHVAFADSLVDAGRVVNRGSITGAGEVHAVNFDNLGEIEASGGTLRIVGTDDLDLDGGADPTLNAMMGDLVIDGPIDEPVRAHVNVGDGRSAWFVDGWTQESITVQILLQGGVDPAELIGETRIQGRVLVENEGRFSSDVTYSEYARVTLADANAELVHAGLTEYEGGLFEGPGAIVELGGVRVVDDTTIGPIEVYDMDGFQDTNVSVLPGVAFQVDAFQIDTVLGDGYDGTLSLDGTLVINTDDAWRLDEALLVNLTGGTNAAIDGTEFEHRGGMSVRDVLEIRTSVYLQENAFVHTMEPSARIELEGPVGNGIFGGRITGTGTLHVAAESDLRGFGRIETDVENAGEIRAEGGWLQLEGAITEVGTIGAIGEDAGLLVQSAWSTLDGVLNLRDAASVAGGDITNTGATTGHGFVFPGFFRNEGRVAPGSSADGDGSGGTGVLAMFGDYEQSGTGRLELQIGGLELGAFDGVAVGEHAELAGVLDLSLTGGFVPETGDEVVVMRWTTHDGAFETVTGLEIPGGLMWQLAYETDGLRLTVVEGCAGDTDGSGDVDFDDLVRVLAAWGPCAGCPEDLNGDDVVDFGDLLLVLGNWGSCE